MSPQKNICYAPSVMAKVMLSDGTVIDLTPDIIGGEVSRNVDSHSKATLRLANKGGKYDRLIKPMDRIVISASKNGTYRLFSGYIDSAPYLTIGTDAVLTASCTIKRLQNLYWDPGLLTSQLLLTQGGEDLLKPDSGIAESAIEILTKVAKWPKEMIHIAEVPADYLAFAKGIYEKLNTKLAEENEQALSLFNALIGSSGSYGFGGGSSAMPSDVPDEYRAKIEELSKKYGLPVAYICAVVKKESGWNPNAVNVNSNGTGDYGLMQINTCHKKSYPWYFPPNEGWKDGNASLEIGVKMLAGHFEHAKKPENTPSGKLEDILLNTYRMYNAGRGGWKTSSAALANAQRVMQYYNEYVRQLTSVANDAASQSAPAPEYVGLGYKQPEPNVSSAGVPRYGKNASTETLKSIYGRTKEEVSAQLVTIDFCGKRIRVHRLAAGAFVAVSNAIKQTQEYKTGAYKIRQIGTFNWRMKRPKGTSLSWHSFGIAIDINWDTNPQKKPLTYDIPESWIKAFEENGFGWGGRWKSLPDAMHFQYEGGHSGTYLGTAESGAAPSDTSAPGQSKSTLETIFWAFNQMPVIETESYLFRGKKSLINDRPVWTDILALMRASQRSVCSAPDGSLIAWYPDKFGLFGTTPYLKIPLSEIQDLSIDISDDALTTHVFAAGTPLSTVRLTETDWIRTTGVVSLDDMYEILDKIIVLPSGDKSAYAPDAIYRRYGVRPYKVSDADLKFSSTANGGIVPFAIALYTWMEKWTQQFSCSMSMTFMPELFPGARIEVEGYGIQMYVESVTHRFDYQSGFTTSAALSCPVSASGWGEGMLSTPAAIDSGGQLTIINPFDESGEEHVEGD